MIATAEWLRHLEAHLDVAREGRDPEGVHQVRVAAGHLDVWLRLAGWAVLRDDLRWLRRHASGVRDLDVLLADAPPDAWRPWLRRRRALARRGLLGALDAPRLRGLLAALALLPPIDEARARPGVARLARRAVQASNELEAKPADLEKLHGLRRALRRLRYGLEWVGEDVADLKRIQDAFGGLNDLAVAHALLAEYRLRERLAPWPADLEQRLANARDAALGVWMQERGRVAALAG